MKTILAVFGTRPEAIKMCPLVRELRGRRNIRTITCVTGQHRQMPDQVLEAFHIEPEYDAAHVSGHSSSDGGAWRIYACCIPSI